MRLCAPLLSICLVLAALPAHADDPISMRPTPPGQEQDCKGHQLLRPVMATHTQPPYPQVSVMTNEQGTTLLDVMIGADGVPSDVTVATSSGSLRLDEASRDYVKANWKWQPPLNDCKAVSAKTRISINWSLRNANPIGGLAALNPAMALDILNVKVADPSDYPAAAPPLTTPAMSMVMVMMGMSGKVDAAMLHPGPTPALDAKAIEMAKSYHWPQTRMDGKPIGGMYLLMIMWPLPGRPKPDADEIRRLLAMFIPAAAAAQAQPQK
jgi:TonB family protein